jgi:hypothetical protein
MLSLAYTLGYQAKTLWMCFLEIRHLEIPRQEVAGPLAVGSIACTSIRNQARTKRTGYRAWMKYSPKLDAQSCYFKALAWIWRRCWSWGSACITRCRGHGGWATWHNGPAQLSRAPVRHVPEIRASFQQMVSLSRGLLRVYQARQCIKPVILTKVRDTIGPRPSTLLTSPSWRRKRYPLDARGLHFKLCSVWTTWLGITLDTQK